MAQFCRFFRNFRAGLHSALGDLYVPARTFGSNLRAFRLNTPGYELRFAHVQGRKAFLHLSARRAATVPFTLADIGEGIKEVTIKEWFVKEGDRVAQFDQLCEVQSDKASVTITSRYDGIIRKIHHDIDAIAQVGQALVDIEVGGSDSGAGGGDTTVGNKPEAKAEDSTASARVSSSSYDVKTLATPAVRRIAGEHKVNLADVLGTGRDGRVLKEDILNYVNSKQGSSVSEQGGVKDSGPSVQTPVQSGASNIIPGDRVEPMKGYTRAMVKSMTAAIEIPHFGYYDEVNVTSLVALRGQLKDSLSKRGVKFSYMPFFIKAASIALSQYTVLNSSVDCNAGTITYKGAHNIGLAMDTKLGLIVPNIKNVQNLSILDIAVELNRLHESGLQGSIKSEDLSGGTFTLSNIGAIGGTYASPIIRPPEVAVGALGRIQVLPRFDSQGNVVRASVFQVSWSADHRIIDGATMARFSNLWKSFLEDPATMLLYLK